jgi:hypothetical protein
VAPSPVRCKPAARGEFARAHALVDRGTPDRDKCNPVQTRAAISFHIENVNTRRLNSRRVASGGAPEIPAEPWVETDPYGRVIGASPEGARLFNLTVRGLTGRNLSLFFTSRQLISDGLQVLRHGHPECPQLETEYRPMERKRRRLRVKMGTADGDAVRWTFSEVLGDGADPLMSPT